MHRVNFFFYQAANIVPKDHREESPVNTAIRRITDCARKALESTGLRDPEVKSTVLPQAVSVLLRGTRGGSLFLSTITVPLNASVSEISDAVWESYRRG